MVTIYLSKAGQCPTDQLVAQLAKNHIDGDVPEILRQQRGKPYFADGKVHFSVSHSGNLVAVAFGDAPLGLDLQQHKCRGYESREAAIARFQKIASQYFHPQEQAYLEEDPWDGFFRIWTAKESFVKRTGRGIDHDFREICILPDGDTWQDQNGFFRQTILPGYTLALSTAEPTEWEMLD